MPNQDQAKTMNINPALSEVDTSTTSSLNAENFMIIGFEGSGDNENPYNWSETRKWLMLAVSLVGTLTLPMNGTSITVASHEISRQFDVSDTTTFTNTYWTVTSWTLGGTIFVLVGLPILEDFGIRTAYLISYIFFLLMVIPQAVAQNFATLVVTRFFTGGCVALLANTAASVIPDLWDTTEARGLPVSLYILCYVLGDTLGLPVFAGVAKYMSSWRWIFYVQLIVYGALLPFFILCLHETRHEAILRRRVKTIRNGDGKNVCTQAQLDAAPFKQRLMQAITRPLYLFCTEPVLFFATLWSAFALGLVFLFTQSVEQVFTRLYGWDEYSSGYVQAAVAIGEIVGWMTSLYGIRLYLESAKRNTERPNHPIPEARLYLSVFASFVGITGGMFVYGWTSYPSVPWIGPAIGLGMVGFGTQIVVGAVADYIEDAYAESGFAGSGLSAVCAGENVICGFLPLASQAMYTNLGPQWASSLIGFLALLLSFAPVIAIWKGRMLRERSPFMQSGGKNGKTWGEV